MILDFFLILLLLMPWHHLNTFDIFAILKISFSLSDTKFYPFTFLSYDNTSLAILKSLRIFGAKFWPPTMIEKFKSGIRTKLCLMLKDVMWIKQTNGDYDIKVKIYLSGEQADSV